LLVRQILIARHKQLKAGILGSLQQFAIHKAVPSQCGRRVYLIPGSHFNNSRGMF
jgi:hypothetical protein